MPSLEELEFRANILVSRFERMDKVANRVERDPKSRKDFVFLQVMSNGINQNFAEYESLIGKLAAAFQKLKGEEEMPDFKTELEKGEAHYHNVLVTLATHVDGAGTSRRPKILSKEGFFTKQHVFIYLSNFLCFYENLTADLFSKKQINKYV